MHVPANRGVLRRAGAHRSRVILRWTFIADPVGHTGCVNMGADYALLQCAQRGAGALRLYRWVPGCLSFGRNEPTLTRYNRATIAERGLDTVRRPTGGRAVWHDAEVTYAVAAPAERFGSLAETYNIVHAMLAAALRRLGARVELAARPTGKARSLSSGACFAASVSGEIVANGQKLVGSAQVREGRAFLQHGSILLKNEQRVVAEVTRGTCVEPAGTSLTALLGRTPEFEEIADVIGAEAKQAWAGMWRDGEHPDGEAYVARFADPAWTWRR